MLDDSHVLAQMGTRTVSLGEIRAEYRRRNLAFGADPNDAAPIRDPEFVWRMVDNVLQERRVLEEAERLDLLPERDAVLAAWRAHPELGALWSVDWESTGGTWDHPVTAEHVFRGFQSLLAREAWLQLMVERLDDATILREYLTRNHTITAELIEIPNVPTGDEISDYLRNNGLEVETFYAENAARFGIPASARIRIVRIRPRGDGDEARAIARQTAERLRREVLAGGDLVQMSLEQSEDRAAETDGTRDGVLERELPSAFELDPGELSEVVEDHWGALFFRLEALTPVDQRDLNDVLRREIAAELLGHRRVLARTQDLWQHVADLALDSAALDSFVSEGFVRRQIIGPFLVENEFVPGVGAAPHLHVALVALEEPGETLEIPVRDGSAVYWARLINHNIPTRADFEAERDAFVITMQNLVRETAWRSFWRQCLNEEPVTLMVGDDYFDVEK